MPMIKGACVLAGATWPYMSSPRTLTLAHGEAWDLTTNPAISEQPAPQSLQCHWGYEIFPLLAF